MSDKFIDCVKYAMKIMKDSRPAESWVYELTESEAARIACEKHGYDKRMDGFIAVLISHEEETSECLDEIEAMKTREDSVFKAKVLAWLKNHLSEAWDNKEFDLINLYGVGEVNTSLLASEAVYDANFFFDQDPEAILEDETHLLWDLVIDAAEWYVKWRSTVERET